MQLFEHGNIQTLLREQNFNIAAPARSRNSHIKKWLGNTAGGKGEWLHRIFARTLSALHAERNVSAGVRQKAGTENKSTSRRRFQLRLRFLDRRIIFHRAR